MKQLPHNAEAERVVLGAVLVDDAAIARVAALLGPDDFHLEEHRRIFRAMVELAERGRAIDLVLLNDALVRRGELQAVGGVAYTASLVDGLPRITNVHQWCEIVRRYAALRTLVLAGNRLVGEALSRGADPAHVADRAGELLRSTLRDAAHDTPDPAEAAKRAGRMLEQMHAAAVAGRPLGLQTGFPGLDARVHGFNPGDLVIVGARPSMGKTAFLVDVGERVAARGCSVLMFSAEMRSEWICARRLSAQSGLRLDRFRAHAPLQAEEWHRLALAVAEIAAKPFHVDDTALQPAQIRARARYRRALNGLDLVLVDYLQYLSGGPGRRWNTREQEVAAVCRAMKQMAHDLDCVVIAAAQLSRAAEHRSNPKPTLTDLRDSGGLEQDADVVLLIHRDRRQDDEQALEEEAEIIVAKQRNGPTGTVRLRFNGELMRFESREDAG